MKQFSIFQPMKNDSRFEYVSSIFWVYFSHKTEKFRFWKSLKHFNNFWITLIFFDQEKMLLGLNISCQIVSNLVKLHSLSLTVVISWDIQILNFIEIFHYFSIKESVVRSKFDPVFFFVLIVFLSITIEIALNWKNL